MLDDEEYQEKRRRIAVNLSAVLGARRTKP